MYQTQLYKNARRVLVLLLAAAMLFVAVGGSNVVLADQPDDATLLREAENLDAADLKRNRLPASPSEKALDLDREAPEAQGKPIKDQYIVVFKDGVADAPGLATRLAAAHGGSILYTYEHALQGFAVKMPAVAAQALERNPNVDYVEQDREVSLADTQSPATWGIDRIDQRDLPLDDSYTYNYTGSGVNAYIVDTGIRHSHNEFGGRAKHGYTAINDGRGSSDCNGHGTHVAGTVGGSTYGVAKNVTLYAVRVLDCNGSGTISGVVAGVDWVTNNHTKPAVANMSLGGGASSSLDSAVRNSIAAGVTYAVAAGNSNADACNYSPARVSEALTVGSSTSSDSRSSFSNWGTCVDIFAPGSDITSAWHTSDSATNTISGTSMASPHTAGAAALYLESNPGASPATVGDAILSDATPNRLSGIGSGSPNLLLYSLLNGGGGDPPPPDDPGDNVIVNGDFEDGSGVGWTESSSGGYTLITQDRPRSGSWSAWLGGYNSATDYIYQKVTVPSGGTLDYYVRVESQEPSGSTVYDYMEVRLYDGNSGSYITTLETWSNASTRNSWLGDSIDLSGYGGQSVYIMFYGRTDSIYATSFFIDDVVLK